MRDIGKEHIYTFFAAKDFTNLFIFESRNISSY